MARTVNRPGKYFLLLYVSLLVITLIPTIVLGSLAIDQVTKGIHRELQRSNSAVLNAIQRTVDGRLLRIQNDFILIQNNRNFAANFTPAQSIGESIFYLRETQQVLSDMVAANQLLHSIVIYFPANNRILTNTTTSVFDAYPNAPLLFPDGEEIPDEGVRTIIDDIRLNTHVDVYPFFRRDPRFGDTVNAVTVMNIRIAALTAILRELRFSPDVVLDIVDENGIQVTSTHRAEVAATAFTIEAIPSDFFRFSYRAVIPRSFFDDRTRPISRFIVIMSIVLTAVDGIVAYGISRGLYHPVSRVMNAIIQPGSQSDIDQSSEFTYIQAAVNSYLNTNTRLKTLIEQERDPISFNLLRNLFEHSSISRESLEKSLAIIGISIDHDHFTVLAVESVEPDMVAELLPRLLQCTVRETVNETAASFELSAVPAAMQRNRFHVLLMSNVSSARHQSIIRQFAEGLIEKLSRRLETNFVGSLGPSEPRVHLVSISYREANAALDQKFFRSTDGPILDYVDTLSRSKSFLFPEVEISRIIKMTFSHDPSGIDAQLEVMFSLFETYTLSERAIKSVVNHLLFVLATQLRERIEELSDVFQNGNALISELEQMTSVGSLKTWLRSLLFHTANVVHKNLSRYSIQVETAIDFIKRNYMNPISLPDVADALNISSQHLSKIFKDETGHNYIDFLNGMRLERAYALVVDTDLLIKEIASRTGFSNSQYLIKRFKAKYRVTPSQLRLGAR